ncbi:ArsR/SmtB family transcription factor [Brevibacillus sp. B_LB10_24]|uniref:ArsR/SmtB family transcription factor n=1 Tax=Brevibacillus sp. B_LB10_24 TaxID=3380645 RepID=UPI0038B9C743
MKRYFIIESSEQLRTVSDPLRLHLLHLLMKEEYTGKQLADIIGVSASKIHYHLKELEQQGFIEIVRTEEKNGIMQKFYRSVAFDYKISDELLPSLRENTSIIQENMANSLKMAVKRVYDAPEDSFRWFADEKERPPVFLRNFEIKAPRSEIKAWLEKYEELIEELDQLEQRYLLRAKEAGLPDEQEIFYMVQAGFMTNEQYFVAENTSLPKGFEEDNHIFIVKKKGE